MTTMYRLQSKSAKIGEDRQQGDISGRISKYDGDVSASQGVAGHRRAMLRRARRRRRAKRRRARRRRAGRRHGNREDPRSLS